MDTNNRKKKVLCPVERGGDNGKEAKTFWMRVGTAFLNKDGSINIYLDATPKNMKLQVRDFDERDLAPRPPGEARAGLALTDGVPF